MTDMTENTYSALEVVRMEAQVVAVLEWRLAVPCSSLKFMHAFAGRAKVSSPAAPRRRQQSARPQGLLSAHVALPRLT